MGISAWLPDVSAEARFWGSSLSQKQSSLLQECVASLCANCAPVVSFLVDQGLLLLIDLIRLLSPSHVVQFSSDRGRYMPDLSPSYVDSMDGLYTKSTSKVRNRGFHLAEFADSLEFADDEKENPLLFTGYKLMSVKSEFVSGKTPRNR